MRAGVLLVDKPRGPTSHDVVARLRRILRTRQIGHAGTLDPMATGVLVLAIDEATKLVPWLTADDKSYEARLELGVGTDTLDAEGREIARAPIDGELARALAEIAAGRAAERVEAALVAERGRREQVPPAFSAIRVGGERAHEIARRGGEVELAARPVEVKRLVVTGAGPSHVDLAMDVTKGYFVRSLARDFAAALGTVGHLTSLRRTRSGCFAVEDAVELARSAEDGFADAIIPLERAAARTLPVSVLTEVGVTAARRGQRVRPEDLRDGHPRASAWLDESGRLVAIGEASEDGGGKVLRGFAAD